MKPVDAVKITVTRGDKEFSHTHRWTQAAQIVMRGLTLESQVEETAHTLLKKLESEEVAQPCVNFFGEGTDERP